MMLRYLYLSFFIAVSLWNCVCLAAQELSRTYRDESHCLTDADMRGDSDMSISCWCRDVIVDARYVYFTYVVTSKDPNLNGPFLDLARLVSETCGDKIIGVTVGMQRDWIWYGPEVIRSYPSDEVIKKIKVEPMDKSETTLGRWVPLTIQLIYRDKQGNISKTDTYSTREFIPDFDAAHSN